VEAGAGVAIVPVFAASVAPAILLMPNAAPAMIIELARVIIFNVMGAPFIFNDKKTDNATFTSRLRRLTSALGATVM
jgi:hypothetical protein